MSERIRRHGTVGSLALGLAFFAFPGAISAQQSGADVMQAAADRFSTVESFCVNFHQIMEVTLLRERKESRGNLCQVRPNLFSMVFEDPDGDRIVSDGTYFWLYYPSIDETQVIRSTLEAGEAEHDFFSRFLDRPSDKYEIDLVGSEEVEGAETSHIELSPIGSPGFTRAEVWIDSQHHLIRRLRIHDDNGSIRTLTLTEFGETADIPEDRFTFEPPSGSQVIIR